jgi:hypothetical protein
VLAVQPYGNEGIFRAFLFALPWSAVLVARQFMVTPDRPRPRWAWARFVIPAALVTLWVPTSFGLELSNFVFRSDVRTAIWASEHLPTHAAYELVTSGVPIPMTGDYAQHLQTWQQLNQPLTAWPGFAAAAASGPTALAAHAARAASWYPAADVYLFLGPAQRNDVRYFGEFGPTTWAQFEAAVAASPRFVLVHRDGDSSVWRFTGSTTATAG